jgi:hypothetical protein
MTTQNTGKQMRDERRLKIYIGAGALYLVCAAVQLVGEWRHGDLAQPANLLWLVGAVAFAWGIVHSLRVLAEARQGEVVGPDERQRVAAGRAGLATVKVMVFVTAAVVGVQTGADGALPLAPTLLLVVLLAVFYGEYAFHLRRMS